jgi:hypothetical protein
MLASIVWISNVQISDGICQRDIRTIPVHHRYHLDDQRVLRSTPATRRSPEISTDGGFLICVGFCRNFFGIFFCASATANPLAINLLKIPHQKSTTSSAN